MHRAEQAEPLKLQIRCVCGQVTVTTDEEIGRRPRCRCGRRLSARGASALVTPARRAAPAGATGPGLLTRAVRALARLGAPRAARRPPTAPKPGAAPRPVPVPRAAGPLALARRVLTIGVWAYLAGAVLAALLLWGTADRWWPGTILLFSGRWVLLLPLAVLAPAALLLRFRLLLPLAVAAAIVVVPVMGYRLRLPGAAADAPADFRVISYNVANREWVALDLPTLIGEWDADVVAMQECGDRFRGMMRVPDGWHRHESAQLCLLTRFPIREAETMDRTDFEVVARAGLGGSASATRYLLETPAGPLHVANLHLETVRKGVEAAIGRGSMAHLSTNTEIRNLESKRVRQWLDADGAGPLLVMGDFNMPVESAIYRAWWGDLENAHSAVGSGLGATRYNGWIHARIDHVLLGPGLRAVRADVGHDLGSDHLPVVVAVRRSAPTAAR